MVVGRGLSEKLRFEKREAAGGHWGWSEGSREECGKRGGQRGRRVNKSCRTLQVFGKALNFLPIKFA